MGDAWWVVGDGWRVAGGVGVGKWWVVGGGWWWVAMLKRKG